MATAPIESLAKLLDLTPRRVQQLAKEGVIEQEEALRAADSRDGLALKFRLSEGASGEHDPYADFSAAAPASITHGF